MSGNELDRQDGDDEIDLSSDPGLAALAKGLVAAARSEGVELTGPGGLLAGLTRQVLETALEVEMSEHLGCDRHDQAGDNSGNSRNGITEDGPDRAR